MDKVDPVRQEALRIIIKTFEEKSYSNILIKNLDNKFSVLDRSFITEIVYGVIKWRLRIDNAIDNLSSIKTNKIQVTVLNILRLGIYQMSFMSKVPHSAAVNECVKLAKKMCNPGAAKYINAVLRNYSRNASTITYPDKKKDIIKYLSVYYSFPEWIVSKLIGEFGNDFTESFLEYSNHIPPLTVRLNKLKIDKNSLKESLLNKGIYVQDSIYMDDALILKGVPGIENLEEYKEGKLTVQDESSMLAARILSPQKGELIIDVCSAPGTKSTYMAEWIDNDGKILSGDVNKSKLNLVKENAKRLGISIIDTYCHDASIVLDDYKEKAHKVLIDAPCTGFGIMRKKPDIRWNRNIEDVEKIKSIQKAILDASCSYVKPGGVLVYSTCTVLKEENIDLVYNFLRHNKKFKLEDISDFVPEKLLKPSCREGYIELYPNVDGVDGFFIARLRRVE